ncbi:hypothetical protein FGO68_gene6920 [Halteria grandinella]|uniref:DUF7630 domain-containing protein n=1 Tax=Halteria grandinella TaxID=5974 RepID=A0A8J8TB61_HALGN|nr:hypothetical protein FGO68_gene6920 [Halteria grandinella]
MDVYITNSDFQGTSQTQKQTQSFGYFLQIASSSQVSIAQSIFNKGYAQSGGAMYVLGNAILNIESSQFTDNIAIDQGGVLFADSFKSISISNSCSFKNNKGIKNGGDALYIYNSPNGQAFIEDTLFSSLNTESNFIYASDIHNLTMKAIKAEVYNPKKTPDIKYSGLYFRNQAHLKIFQSNFSGIIGSNLLGGGAVVIEYSYDVQEDLVEITDCIFENSHASNKGGGITLIDVKSTVIQTSTFSNNSADKQGGGLMFDCNKTGFINYDCKLKIVDSVFKQNTANIEGGAIKWNFNEALINRETIFLNNTASVYGDAIAGVAHQLVVIDKEQLDERKYKMQNNRNNVRAVSSGGEINMYFGIIDKQGDFVRTDNKSKLFISQVFLFKIFLALLKKPPVAKKSPLLQQLKQRLNSLPQMVSSKLKSLFLLQHQIQAKVIEFSLYSFLVLNFITDAINIDIPSNRKVGDKLIKAQELAKNEIIVDNPLILPITLQVRGCIKGEEMLSNGKCRQCAPGSYMIKAPTSAASCLTCQTEKSVCQGGSQIYPLSGYWRSTVDSDNIMECLNPGACLGGQFPLLNLTGQCAHGYQGILCASCNKGYTLKQQSRECKKCPTIVINSLILAAFAVLALVIIIVLVWSNLKSSGEEERNYLPVYFRILVNHLQVVTLVASFDFNQPEEFKTFFKGFKPVAEAQSEIFSVDCLLYYYSHDSSIKPYYVKSIVLFALPPAMIILSIFAWLLIYQKKVLQKKAIQSDQLDNEVIDKSSKIFEDKDKQLEELDRSTKEKEAIGDFSGNIILTIIVILFLVHPTITREMFNLFKQAILHLILYSCKTIEGVERLYLDLEAICYQGQHSIASSWFGVPSLIIYGAGIPFIGFLAIYRNRYNLERSFVKQRYGFLYNGYKTGHASYWEIFVIYRKVVIIFIQVYFVQNGKLVQVRNRIYNLAQALMTLLFLGTMMALVKYLQPYNKYCLNQLEFLSLLTSMASVYFCIYFISNKIDSSQISKNLAQ